MALLMWSTLVIWPCPTLRRLTGLLRQTALTWMADSGVPSHVVQRLAGHTDPAVTARYLHPDMRALIEAGTAFFGVVGPEWGH